ncbi:MAG TPA: DinB family protein [Flavipsychrobacter sp.]|nr:DinB family protein [Flavipsychrobacter sp.]
MQNLTSKAKFLKKEYIADLQKIAANTQPLWGKMNFQQMVEHMAEYVAMAYGNPEMELTIPEDKVEKAQDWLKTEKPFKENTPNSLLPETPRPVEFSTVAEAIADLQNEINNFFNEFDTVKKKYVMNPFFGELDYGMSIQLLYKHATHHLRQFGMEIR